MQPAPAKSDARTCASSHAAETPVSATNEGRGVPREIISDRDIRFTKGFWKKWQTRLGISLRFTSARTQHSNGGAERAIATFEE